MSSYEQHTVPLPCCPGAGGGSVPAPLQMLQGALSSSRRSVASRLRRRLHGRRGLPTWNCRGAPRRRPTHRPRDPPSPRNGRCRSPWSPS